LSNREKNRTETVRAGEVIHGTFGLIGRLV